MSDTGSSRAAAPSGMLAKARKSLWPGMVWAFPLAALLIVAYLGIQSFAERGFTVVVTFDSAEGAREGDTKVIYKGIEVGRVTDIELAQDGQHADLTLRLDRKLEAQLGPESKFWLVGSNPSLTDLRSLKAAVAGISIGMAPQPGPSTRRFVGLKQEPAIPPDTPGRAFRLDTDTLGPLRRGSTVAYRGDEVGSVVETTTTGASSFRLHIFVRAPYDQYIRPESMFWTVSPLRISLGGDGITGQLASPQTALSGGIAFDTPIAAPPGPPSPADALFRLFGSEDRARQGPDGPPVLYDTEFRGAAGQLQVGASVVLRGARVGIVDSVGLRFDPESGILSNPVTFALFPLRLHVPGVDPAAMPDWRAISDRAVQKLVDSGYRASVSQSPPLIGSFQLSLDKVAEPTAVALDRSGPNPRVPAAPEAEGGSLFEKADSILTKVNAIPFDAIGSDVRQITGRLSKLVSSPQLDSSIAHLDSTLKSLDQMATQVRPQVGPLVAKLNQTAEQLRQAAVSANGVLGGIGAGQDASLAGAIRQLTDAARSIRALADYLQRNPEALLNGKRK
ncbi:MlaD family protein [soil metagenome]